MNQTVMSIFCPTGVLTCQALGADPVEICILTAAACPRFLLTPLAAPDIALCMDLDGCDIKLL